MEIGGLEATATVTAMAHHRTIAHTATATHSARHAYLLFNSGGFGLFLQGCMEIKQFAGDLG